MDAEEVFLDAEEDITPRRSGRKRRSTAGSSTPAVIKRPKTKEREKMPTRHSPKADGKANAGQPQAQASSGTGGRVGPGDMDQDDFWAKMGGMFGGLETRMKRETDEVKEQLGVAVNTSGDLGLRVERAEKRLDGLAEEVNSLVDKRLACLPLSDHGKSTGPSYAAAFDIWPLAGEVPGGKDRRWDSAVRW